MHWYHKEIIFLFFGLVCFFLKPRGNCSRITSWKDTQESSPTAQHTIPSASPSWADVKLTVQKSWSRIQGCWCHIVQLAKGGWVHNFTAMCARSHLGFRPCVTWWGTPCLIQIFKLPLPKIPKYSRWGFPLGAFPCGQHTKCCSTYTPLPSEIEGCSCIASCTSNPDF